MRDGTRPRRWFARTHAGWLRAEVRLLLQRGRACSCLPCGGTHAERLTLLRAPDEAHFLDGQLRMHWVVVERVLL